MGYTILGKGVKWHVKCLCYHISWKVVYETVYPGYLHHCDRMLAKTAAIIPLAQVRISFTVHTC